MHTTLCGAVLTTAILCGVAACATAQTPAGALTFRKLTTSVAQVEGTQVRDLRIQWTREPGPAVAGQAQAAAPQTNVFSLLQEQTSTGGLRRERAPQLSATQLVVVVQDASGRELDWRTVMDPSTIRAEFPGPDGTLSGRVVEQRSSELLVSIPDVAGADRLRIYRPVWNGRDYDLEALGSVPLGPAR